MKRMIFFAVLALLATVVPADEYLNLVNSARQGEGRGELALSDEIAQLAWFNNMAMLEHNASGHYGGWEFRRGWLEDHDIEYDLFGEVACWFALPSVEPAYVLEVFRNSPSHWNALMNARFIKMTYVVTQIGAETAVTILLLED